MKKLTLFFAIIIPFLGWSQNFIQEKTNEYFEFVSPEKVYAHTNKTLFQPGETIYLKAYITDGIQQISDKSSVLYLEVISPAGTIMETQVLAINKGRAEGSFTLPADAVGGLYKFLIYTNWQRNFDIPIFEKHITVQRILAPRLLIKLNVEKEAYGNGDWVEATLSVRNLQDISIKNLEFEYSAMLDQKQFLKQMATTDENGEFKIRFKLPDILSGNDGSLNVIFMYESNVESISRTIPIILNDLDLQFLPEGGFVMDNSTHNFAFKALNKYGKPADVKGEILDQSGNKISDFESFHQGMGNISFQIESDKQYFAKITSPFLATKLIELPKSEKRPASLILERINEDQVKIIINSETDQNLELIGRTISSMIFSKEYSLKSGKNEFIIETNDLPMGILQFTLFKKNIPIAERLIFNHQDKGLNIKIETDKESYNTREKVNAKVRTSLPNGNPISANLSVSVVNDKLLSYHDDKQHDINSWLLAGSELKGEIYEPEFYFDPTESKRQKALDLLMLTQGWRYYNWDEILSDENIGLQYIAESANQIVGTVFKDDRISYPTTVYLLINELIYVEKTDEKGVFRFDLGEPILKTAVLYSEKKAGEYVWIEFMDPSKVSPSEIKRKPNDSYQENSEFRLGEINTPTEETTSNQTQNNKDFDDDFWEEDGKMELSAVTLLGGISIEKTQKAGAYTVISASQIELTPIASVDQVLSGRVAGIQFQTNSGMVGAGSQVIIRGVGTLSGQNIPLLVIDGIPISGDGISLAQISPNMVKSIQVLKGVSATALYGSRAANGAIIIDTNGTYYYSNNDLNINLGLSKELHQQSYQPNSHRNMKVSVAKEFYVPKYNSIITETKDDFRSCIYWNYNVTTNQKGKAEFSFYNSDESTVFRIIAEGFNGTGLVGRNEKTYSTFDKVELDVKFPLYATEGDKILMPIWVKNNSSKLISANLTQDLPNSLKLLDYKYDLELNPEKTATIHAPLLVENGKKGKYKFRVNLLTNEFRQSVVKELEIFERGFPMYFGKSTLNETLFKFNSENVISGSQSAIFTISLNLTEPILNGIERILREPSGCFEQVSSSTYPNIYAMKLLQLKENQNKTEQREKAQKYLQSGYKKLAAYEVRGNGFEWYGKTPANEALSAFGLIEFLEMKPFVKVDENMIKRTREWLISRKDGNGGYLQDKGKYAFSNANKTVVNAYVNYALSFAGEKNIEKEYQLSYKEATNSKDVYRLSLNALTAHQLGKNEDYQRAMNLIKNEIFSRSLDEIKVESSITRSGTQSLKVETLALYALALMKTNQASSELNQIIKEIVNSGSNGYFGSTQATGLALKVLYEYNHLFEQNKEMQRDELFLKVNNQIVVDGKMSDYHKMGLAENKNSIQIDASQYVVNGDNKVEMRIGSDKLSFADFSYSYRSSLPDNSKAAKLNLKTSLSQNSIKVGETVQMLIEVKNISKSDVPMSVAKIGIPGGLSVEPTLLKELLDKEKVAYYELIDNFLILYWYGFEANETKKIDLIFKAEIPGEFTGVASSVYLYYTEEDKNWNEGLKVDVKS